MTLKGRFDADINPLERSRRIYEEMEWLRSFGMTDLRLAAELGIQPNSIEKHRQREADNDFGRPDPCPGGGGNTKAVEVRS